LLTILDDTGAEISISFTADGSDKEKVHTLLGLGGRVENSDAIELLSAINRGERNSLFVGGYFNGRQTVDGGYKAHEFCLKDWFVCMPVVAGQKTRSVLTEQDFHPDATPELSLVQRTINW
jgi:hypothetical protein